MDIIQVLNPLSHNGNSCPPLPHSHLPFGLRPERAKASGTNELNPFLFGARPSGPEQVTLSCARRRQGRLCHPRSTVDRTTGQMWPQIRRSLGLGNGGARSLPAPSVLTPGASGPAETVATAEGEGRGKCRDHGPPTSHPDQGSTLCFWNCLSIHICSHLSPLPPPTNTFHGPIVESIKSGLHLLVPAFISAITLYLSPRLALPAPPSLNPLFLDNVSSAAPARSSISCCSSSSYTPYLPQDSAVGTPYLFFWFLFFSQLHPRHLEVPQLGGRIQSELQLPTPQPQQRGVQATSAIYTTAHSNAGSRTHLSEARDHTRILTDTLLGSYPAELQREPHDTSVLISLAPDTGAVSSGPLVKITF